MPLLSYLKNSQAQSYLNILICYFLTDFMAHSELSFVSFHIDPSCPGTTS